MTFTELGHIPYGFVDAAPYGEIRTQKQYDYIIYYEKNTSLGFYWSDNDRHIPTFEECRGKCLNIISFFGGAAFYFVVNDFCYIWNHNIGSYETTVPEFNYGMYGKITLN